MRIVLFTDVSVFRRSLSRNGLLVMFDPAKFLAGTNTRRVRRALAALFGGDGRQGHGEPDVAQGEERLERLEHRLTG